MQAAAVQVRSSLIVVFEISAIDHFEEIVDVDVSGIAIEIDTRLRFRLRIVNRALSVPCRACGFRLSIDAAREFGE